MTTQITSQADGTDLALMAGTGGPVGITTDHRSVPLAFLDGTTWAEFRWGLAPNGLATRRQLAAHGLRPGGQHPVAEIVWRQGQRTAHLYRVDLAKPKRPMTPARSLALAAAMRARRTCPTCGRDTGYVIPTSLGRCLPCHDGHDSTDAVAATGLHAA